MALILHIASRTDWEAASATGLYEHSSLQTEGFIHCSTVQQLIWVANTFFHGQQALVLLCVESDRLQSDLWYDEVEGIGQFPHVYGGINLDAVVQVLAFEPNANSEFELPQTLAIDSTG